MARELWKGNEALAEAAVRAGVDAYFGYPITPQTELLEYMARRMPELGRTFLQAESEIAAVNMVYGAACAGMRAMTSSSSPGISLMQEGLSYIAGSEVPCVIVDIMRGSPGLGNIQPSQADYFQMTRGAGHGDFHPIVLAPATVQEAVDLIYLSFDLAFHYRTLVIIAGDGALGQMMEPVEMPPPRKPILERPDWALDGSSDRPPRVVTSLYLDAAELEGANLRLQEKLNAIRAAEQSWESYQTEDAEWLVVAFGTAGRIAKSAVRAARTAGIQAGLFRPISLWPYPEAALDELIERVQGVLVVEMNAGQMLEDVHAIVQGRVPVRFLGRLGGVIPLPNEIYAELTHMARIRQQGSGVGSQRCQSERSRIL